MIKRRTAAEIIGFHFSSDMREISESRYQPTRFTNPAIYTFGENYYAAPSNNRPPANMKGAWTEVGEHYGRKVFCLHQSQRET